MKNSFRVFVLIAGLTCALPAEAETSQGPSKDVPELAALQYLIGTFDTQVTAPFRTTGKVKGEWVHGGYFLKQTWTREASEETPEMNGTVFLTYDRSKRVYRQWSFDSTSTVFESKGSWDPKKWTMTWTGGANEGFPHAWKMTFDETLAHTWSIAIKDGDGNTVYESRGKTSPTKERQLVYRKSQLATLGLAYHSYYAKNGDSPAKKEELIEFLSIRAKDDLLTIGAIERLKKGEIVIVWNAALSKDGDANDRYRLAWETAVTKTSALMMTGGGFVQFVTPEEFAKVKEISTGRPK